MMEIDKMMFKILERHGNPGLKRYLQWLWNRIKEAIKRTQKTIRYAAKN